MDNRKGRISRLIAECADRGIRDNLDLWPRIYPQVGAMASVRRQPMRHKAAIGLAGAVLALALLIALVPTVRAGVESIVQHLGLAFVDTTAFRGTTVVKLEPSPAPDADRLLNREEIQRQVPFRLRTPASLPDGLVLAGGRVARNGETVEASLEYRRTGDAAGATSRLLMQRTFDGPVVAPPLLPASQEMAVQVNGRPAIYVHGGWRDDGQGDANTAMGSLRWDASEDSAWLTWQEGKLTYLLEAYGLKLDQDDMIRIAESLR